MGKKLLECFTKTNCKKQIKKEFRVENVIKGKGDKLYVEQKGYYNSFNNLKKAVKMSEYFPKPNSFGANV